MHIMSTLYPSEVYISHYRWSNEDSVDVNNYQLSEHFPNIGYLTKTMTYRNHDTILDLGMKFQVPSFVQQLHDTLST